MQFPQWRSVTSFNLWNFKVVNCLIWPENFLYTTTSVSATQLEFFVKSFSGTLSESYRCVRWAVAGANLLRENSTADWLVAGGWCWFSMREQYCWLVGWQAKQTDRIYVIRLGIFVVFYNLKWHLYHDAFFPSWGARLLLPHQLLNQYLDKRFNSRMQ